MSCLTKDFIEVRLDRLQKQGRSRSPTNRHLSEGYRRWLEKHQRGLEQHNPAEAKAQQDWDKMLRVHPLVRMEKQVSKTFSPRRKRRPANNIVRKKRR